MVTVCSVEPRSAAGKADVRAGDILLSVNGHEINDVLDYRFYTTEKKITLLLHRGPELLEKTLVKPEYADPGLGFDSPLMDKQHSCRNKCVFCFIDQLPKGMRSTLYFKDDDSRMSFLSGSYVTMTNMSDEDLDRIVKMRTSPINISVHTTDPELRVKMMKNPRAALICEQMKKLKDAGIGMNGQIVLCKGFNDGEALERTMRDLAGFYPEMESVSVVPIGLTCHREGLCPIEPFSPEECRQVIAQVNAFAARCLEKSGSRIFFCSDEFYLRGGVKLPEEREYEGYPQLDNGVGSIRSMKTEFEYALEELKGEEGDPVFEYSVATGTLAAPFIEELVSKMHEKAPSLCGTVYPIENDFFGRSITVAGLVTGRDLTEQLKGKKLGKRLFLPRVMLRHEGDRFLDDMTPEQVEEILGVKVTFVENDGCAFLTSIAGAEGADD